MGKQLGWSGALVIALVLSTGCGDGTGLSASSGASEVARAEQLPSEARLEAIHAFGDFMDPKYSYANEEDVAADARDGTLRVLVTDEDGETPIPRAVIACGGEVDGQPLRVATGEDGRATFTGVPAIWLAMQVHTPAESYFERSHERAVRVVHGPGDLTVVLARRRWFRFEIELPDGVAQPEDIELTYVREGFEGLPCVTETRAGNASLDSEDPRRIALPEGRFTLRMSFTFRPDLPSVLLTGIEASADPTLVNTVSVFGGIPVLGRVSPPEGGSADPLSIELQQRRGREIVERIVFDGSNTVERLGEGGTSHDVTHPRATMLRPAGDGRSWDFESPLLRTGAAVDVVARSWRGGTVVAWARQRGVVAGGAPADLRLTPAVTVRGSVLGGAGSAPEEPVAVRAVWPDVRLSRQALIAETRTAADGTFELAGLPGVPVRILAGGSFESVYTPTPFEGVPSPDATVHLRVLPTRSVTGRFLDDATGRPLAIDVTMHQDGLTNVSYGTGSKATGRCRLSHVVPGPMRLVLRHRGQYPLELDPIEIAPETTDIRIRLPE